MPITIQWPSLMLMALILASIANHTFQMDQVINVIVVSCSAIDWVIASSNYHFLSGYQEKFYFNPGDTGFKVILCCSRLHSQLYVYIPHKKYIWIYIYFEL
jgi:hypothetical protein